jgi:biopolymer transport protein ExbD
MSSATHHRQHKVRLHLRSGKKHVKGQVKGDINVTPLVDVVLVLLIIFMVVTPMIASGVAVDLPRTEHHGRKPDDGKDIIISVTKTKDIFIGPKKVRVEDVARVVEEEKRRSPEKTVFLKGDTLTTYGAVRGVMEALHKTGIEDINLGTEEVKQIPAASKAP